MQSPLIIDLSADNGSNIDFNAIAAAGVKHVILRASLGFGDVDKMLTTNAANASAAGLSVSYYHLAYTHPNVDVANDAAKQAWFFCATIASLPSPEWLVIDSETPNLLSSSDFLLWMQTFLNTVKQKTGIDVIIYSNKSYLDTNLPSNHGLTNALFIANYNNIDTPPLPNGWSSFFLWQYSETGSVSGVNGHVDCSTFNA